MGLPCVNVYSNLYVTPSIHVKRKRKKKKTVCEEEKITMKIDLSQQSNRYKL